MPSRRRACRHAAGRRRKVRWPSAPLRWWSSDLPDCLLDPTAIRTPAITAAATTVTASRTSRFAATANRVPEPGSSRLRPWRCSRRRVERTDDFERRQARMEQLVAELRARTAQVAGGGGERAIERHRSRGKLLARERIDRLVDPGTAFLELNALAAWDVYDGQAPSAGIVTGDRRRRGQRVRDRRERRDGEGRLVLPADGEEAPARAGGRRAEPAAVPLPRRLGRRVPAAAGRGVPRPRPLRPHLLQPGAHVGRRASRRSRS